MKDLDFHSIGGYTTDIIISIFIFLLAILEIWLINKFSNYLKKKVRGISSNPLKIQSFVLIGLGKQRLVFLGMINFLRVIGIFMSVYFSLLLILSLFPNTHDIVTKTLDFTLTPLQKYFYAFLDYLPKLFTIVITIFVFRYLRKIVRMSAIEIEEGNLTLATFKPQWARTTAKVINFFLLAFLLIFIIPLLPGYESLAFKGVATFLAALITIGGSSVIANFMAGIVISYIHPCKIGDWIQIESTIGEVIEMSQFAIKIRTAHGLIVSVPYTKGLSSHIKNYSGEEEDHSIRLHTTISIGYEVPWDKVNELLMSAASITEYIDLARPIFVRQVKLDDFYVVYEVNAHTNHIKEMYHIYSELHKNILEAFKNAGIEILSPHYRKIKE